MSSDPVKSPTMEQNRFALCHKAFKAIRKMHHPGNRIQDTTADAFRRLGAESPEVPIALNTAAGAVLESPPQQVTEQSQEAEQHRPSHWCPGHGARMKLSG